MREWTRAALDEYAADLRGLARVWVRTGEKYFGCAARARLLEAELLIVYAVRFRRFNDGLALRLAPLFLDRPEAATRGRLN